MDLKNDHSKNKPLVFQKNKKMHFLNLKDILFFEKQGNICFIHTSESMNEMYESLITLETKLPDSFLRVQKSYIINISNVEYIYHFGNGSYVVNFINCKKQAFMSKHYYDILQKRLEETGIYFS